ncbi:MAG: enoyl-CoA hydratase/isomerase family protein [Deltaproteobacteria bacterium]|nr:enoyl-CoA hydratase/isomerase family protein [Deltaproteobacteria bacterium]
MSQHTAAGLHVERRDDVLRLTLARADRRNAFDGPLLDAFVDALRALEPDVRAVLLAGEGEAFCAGADLGWFAGADEDRAVRREEALRVSRAFAALDAVPVPVVARVHGAAVGGGVGLAVLADVAVAAEDATFQLAEVRVGLVPAMVAPYVARRIGPARMRHWALTAERIGAARAADWALVDAVVSPVRLDEEVERRLEALRAGEPGALRTLKAFLRAAEGRAPADVADEAVRAISGRLADPEARRRIRGFLERSRRG